MGIWDIISTLLGLSIGLVGGIAVGSVRFKRKHQPRSFKQLDVAADFDDTVDEPEDGAAVPAEMTAILKYTDSWVCQPDYERVLWLNHILKAMWPHVSKIAWNQAILNAKPQMDAVIDMVPAGILESLELEAIDVGQYPWRLGGVKMYDTREDTLILETPVIFGSDCKVRVGVKLRVGPYAIYIPIEASNAQVRGVVRFTVDPIVDTIPCLGAMSISLLEAPHLTCNLALINQLDLFSLPGIKSTVRTQLRRVMSMLMVYPNKLAFPIMDKSGLSPPPQGMLTIKLVRAENLRDVDLFSKSDPYVELSVREGRTLRTRTIDNDLNPVWNEKFTVLVDDPSKQSLLLFVRDDDVGFQDDDLGYADLPLHLQPFMQQPGKIVKLSIKLAMPDYSKLGKAGKGAMADGAGAVKKVGAAVKDDAKQKKKSKRNSNAVPVEKLECGLLHIQCQYRPFHAAHQHQEAAAQQTQEQIAKQQEVRQLKRTKTVFNAALRGVLTVTVVRCIELDNGQDANEIDAYVLLALLDPLTGDSEEQRTKVQVNDESPRYSEKFDFVNVTAVSVLTATVFDKSGGLAGRVSLKPWQKKPDQNLGYQRISVEQVVRNKKIKDVWPLLEAERGEIEMKLEFQPIIPSTDYEEAL